MSATETLGGRYRLVEPLGAGGMSVVWRAHDEVLGRAVAVKLLAAGFADDAAFRARIRAEAKAAARLAHPHVTTVFDYGESDGRPYVVMEVVEGVPLSRRLADGPLPWRTAVEVCAETAAALSAAHAAGLVHRDVTPANIMLTGTGVKVVDFGVSAAVGASGRDGPGGAVIGTPAYLAPERLAGDAIGPAADVYGLGLVLYQALTGELPWPADTTTQLLAAHRYEPPRPLPALPGVPDTLVDLCTRCLDKDPGARPSSVLLARELAAIAGIRVPMPAGSVAPQRERGAAARGHTRILAPEDAPADPGPAPSRVLVTGLVFVALFLVGAVGAAFVMRHRTAAVATPGPSATATTPPAAAAPVEPAPACSVTYTVRSQWDNGATVDVTLANTGTADLADWTLTFELPSKQRVSQGWNAQWSQKGNTVTARAPGWGAAIPPGTTVTLGFNLEKHGGKAEIPDRFTVGGTRCR